MPVNPGRMVVCQRQGQIAYYLLPKKGEEDRVCELCNVETTTSLVPYLVPLHHYNVRAKEEHR